MAVTVNNAFKTLLLNISENITEEKLESMKFLCDPKIPPAEIERLNTPLALLNALVVNGFLTENNTTFLDELLSDLRLHHLRTGFLKNYQEANPATHSAQMTKKFCKQLPLRVKNFTGRQKDVDEIKSHITGTAPRMTVIIAAPGYGKTALATEIGYEMNEKENVSVIYASAREHRSLESLAKEMLECLGITPGNDPVNQVQYQLKCLKEQTLLIIDNTEDLQIIEDEGEKFVKFIEKLLNSNNARHLAVILTTRKPFGFISFDYQEKRLEPLTKNFSAELLDYLTPGKNVVAEVREDLGEACGGIPLYIRIVASFIRKGYDPAVLLQTLTINPIYGLKVKNPAAQDYHKALLKFLEECLAADLLNALIRVAVFAKDFSAQDAKVVIEEQSDCEMLLVRLAEHAMLFENGSSFSLHPLIHSLCSKDTEAIGLQDEARNAQDLFNSHYVELILDETQQEFLTTSCKLAIDKFNRNKLNILQAVYNCLQAEKPDDIKRRCISVCVAATNFLAKVITSDEFHKLYSHCSEAAQKMKDNKMYSFALTSLGFRHIVDSTDLQLKQSAQENLERAYDIQTRELSDEDRDCEEHAHCMSKLGLCYVMSKEQVKKGVDLVEKALELRKKLNNEVLIAAGYGELANTYRLRGELQKAINVWESENLARYRDLLGKHPFTGSTLNWIGMCYDNLNNFDKAAEYKKEALQMRKEFLGPDHQDVLSSEFELAQIQAKQGHLETARHKLEDVLSRQEKLLGCRHPHTVQTCNALEKLRDP